MTADQTSGTATAPATHRGISSWLVDRSIRTKILSVVGLLAVVAVGTGILAVSAMSAMMADTDEIDTWLVKQADNDAFRDATLVPAAVASPDGTYDAVLIDGSLPLVSAFVDDLDALDSEVTATAAALSRSRRRPPTRCPGP